MPSLANKLKILLLLWNVPVLNFSVEKRKGKGIPQKQIKRCTRPSEPDFFFYKYIHLSHSHFVHGHVSCLHPRFDFQWSNISHLLSLLKVIAFKKSFKMYFEYSKCRTFCEFLIYEWLFFFHCHDKDLWSFLLCRLYYWLNETHLFCFSFFFIILQFCAVFLPQCSFLAVLHPVNAELTA